MKESINIILKRPITGRCKDCNYTESKRKGTYSYQCPNCGSKNMTSSIERLPYNSVSLSNGCYDWAHPNDVGSQYYFRLRENKDKLSVAYIIDKEKEFDIDNMTPVEAAEELLKIYEKYIYTSSTKELPRLIEYLKKYEEEDEKNKNINRINKLKEELFWLLEYNDVV